MSLTFETRSVFYLNWFCAVLFNLLYMYLLTMNICFNMTWCEYVLLFWIIMILFEEFRQIWDSDYSSQKLNTYWKSKWNQSDIAIVAFFLVGYTTHLVYSTLKIYENYPAIYRNLTEHLGHSDYCPLKLDWYLYSIQVTYNFHSL